MKITRLAVLVVAVSGGLAFTASGVPSCFRNKGLSESQRTDATKKDAADAIENGKITDAEAKVFSFLSGNGKLVDKGSIVQKFSRKFGNDALSVLLKRFYAEFGDDYTYQSWDSVGADRTTFAQSFIYGFDFFGLDGYKAAIDEVTKQRKPNLKIRTKNNGKHKQYSMAFNVLALVAGYVKENRTAGEVEEALRFLRLRIADRSIDISARGALLLSVFELGGNEALERLTNTPGTESELRDLATKLMKR